MREDGKIDYIEQPGGDLKVTKSFYEQAFGWTFQDWADVEGAHAPTRPLWAGRGKA